MATVSRPKKTPRTLAPRGEKSRNGVSPSGFVLAEYVTPESYAERAHKPSFLNVLPASENPCGNCTGHCCRARVVINIPDLVRLASPLLMHPASLCDLTEADSHNSEAVMIGETPKRILLRKAADEFCQLNLHIDGQRRCGVHALRPRICRIYPFSFERGKSRYEMGYIACPTQWVVSMERRNEILDEVETFEQDRALDRKLVRQFNKLPEEERTPAGFWTFAMREGGKALGYDVSFLFQEPPRSKLGKRLW